MQPLEKILPQLVDSLGLGKRFRAELIVFHWREIVGEEIAAHTRPGRMRRGVLAVAAKNSVWAHHLSTLKEEIIAKINAFAGENAVSDLKFQAGYFQKDQNEEIDDGETVNIVTKSLILSERELGQIDGMIAAVDDEDIRCQLRRLLAKEATLQKTKKQRSWTPCPVCGVLSPPEEELCPPCRLAAHAAAVGTLRRLLREAPWLGFKECLPYAAGCRQSDYRTARDELIDELTRAVLENENDQLKLKTLSMLLFGVGPLAVGQDIIAATLDKVRRKKNVSPSRG